MSNSTYRRENNCDSPVDYIDRIYEEILQWHREHDDDDDQQQQRWPPVMRRGQPYQRGTVAKRAPLSTVSEVMPSQQQPIEQSTSSSCTAALTTVAEQVTPPSQAKSRPSSLTGSLREKASKLRRSSVSSLTALFDHGSKQQSDK